MTANLYKTSGIVSLPTSNPRIDQDKSHEDHEDDGLHVLPPFDPKHPKNPTPDLIKPSSVLDLSQTFLLNSRPGANQTIYLDFNGHTTSGTAWNSSFTGGADFTTPAFDIDGNAASFSSAELERIQYIWQRVAEDFSPFNVNVSTQAPNVNDLIKTDASDTRWGVRVVVGGSSYDWFNSGAGGVAYIGSFNWNSDTPTYVFEDQLANGDEKYTADATVHEVGHTLGLNHDGRITPSEGYYTGHGSGETGWAPVMGVGYYQNLVQWSKGEYASANNTEDDLQIITTQNGFGYRADDRGNTIATATPMAFVGAVVNDSGIIERRTDVDFYRFDAGTGPLSLTVNPFNRGPNLDILATLYNSAGTVIASSNPTDLLSANISTDVTAGTYYLSVDGIGKGDPLGTGYTDYASLGQYTITGNIVNNSTPEIALTVSPTSVFEDGSPNLVYTFTRVGSITNTLTVNYTVGGTAAFNSDYSQTGATSFSATTGSITFDAGSNTKTLIIDPTVDTINESNETVGLQVTAGSGYTVATSETVIGTIKNDDSTIPSVTLSVAPSAVRENGARNLVYTFTRIGNTTNPLTVNYSVGGTATFNNDYKQTGAASFSATTGTITFDAGSNTKTITIDPTGDARVENDETVTLKLSSGAGYRVGTAVARTGTILNDDSFRSTSPITINDNSSATPYPSTINVAGLSGTIASLKVTLKGINHTYSDDIDVLLESPTGEKTILMSDVGESNDLNNVSLTFASNASQSLSDAGLIASGIYLPTDIGTGDTFPTPAAAGPYNASFAAFTGSNPNGAWKLYVVDDEGQDQGSIANGWTLDISTASGSVALGDDDEETTANGGSGNDVVTGGAGKDVLAGEGGSDLFLFGTGKMFSRSAIGQDTIVDFQPGTDKIALNKATFRNLISPVGGDLNNEEFAVVASDDLAASSGALIIYNSATGHLLYNQNAEAVGLGRGGVFASLPRVSELSASDFLVVGAKG